MPHEDQSEYENDNLGEPENVNESTGNESIGSKAKEAFSGSGQDSADKSLKSQASNAALNKVVGSAPESVQKATQTATKAAQTVQQVTAAAAKAKSAVASFVALVVNPVTWIVLAIVAGVAIIGVGIVAGFDTVGRNENADGCYGVGGKNSPANLELNSDTDWTTRANNAGAWLMSQEFEFLGGKPMTKKQAAGVLGNFIAESGITFAKAERKSSANQSGQLDMMSNAEARRFTVDHAPAGLGLAQWTWNPGRAKDLLDMADSMNKNWYDAEVQLTLIKKELDGSYYGPRLISAGFNDDSKSAEDLTTIFHNIYEGSNDQNMDRRHKGANDFLDVYTGTGTSSGGSCLMGSSGVDTSDIIALAISTSYGTTAESKVSSGDKYGTSKAKQEYKDAKKLAMDIDKDPMPTLYASCDRFVATLLKNTIDTEVPWGSTLNQGQYFLNSPKWEQYTKKSEAQPGDVWITKTQGHVILYIGEHEGRDSIAHASYLDRVAGIGPASFLNENLVDLLNRPYYGYRYIGD